MSHRFLASLGVLAVVIAVLSVARVAGQAPTAAAKTTTAAAKAKDWTLSRTPWGDPDLQGVWNFQTLTPLERPKQFAGKEFLTDTEAAIVEQEQARIVEEDADPAEGDTGTYNQFWFDRGTSVVATKRSSLIVDPKDGRMPPLTPEAEKKRAAGAAEAAARRIGVAPYVYTLFNSWEDHPAFTRCLARPMPRISQSYNQGIQILQIPGYVVIH